MKIEKRVIGSLNKCYSVAPLVYQGKNHFLVAAEKSDPCYLFDIEGNMVDKIWDGPGGVMSMVQVPGSDGQYLSTYKFYSPNDSREAKIVIITPKKKGEWEVRTLVELPHVHRFDILQVEGINYLIACTLKSGHDYKEDWTKPGKVYVAQLPEDLSAFGEENQLKMVVLKEHMTRNHGYYRVMEGKIPTAVISCEEGVYHFIPPYKDNEEWEIRTLIEEAASDAVLIDIDGDGKKELCTLSPFHGEKITIYKEGEKEYKKVYEYPKPVEFLHALYAGPLCGREVVVIGHRGGDKNLFALFYDCNSNEYKIEIIDEGRGPANVFYINNNGKEIMIATNRETDEIAMYSFEE